MTTERLMMRLELARMGLDPAIHALLRHSETWMPATSAGMTANVRHILENAALVSQCAPGQGSTSTVTWDSAGKSESRFLYSAGLCGWSETSEMIAAM